MELETDLWNLEVWLGAAFFIAVCAFFVWVVGAGRAANMNRRAREVLWNRHGLGAYEPPDDAAKDEQVAGPDEQKDNSR